MKSYFISKLTSALNTFIITGKNEEKIRNIGHDVMRKIFNLREKAPLYIKAGMLPFNTQVHQKTVNLFLRNAMLRSCKRYRQ